MKAFFPIILLTGLFCIQSSCDSNSDEASCTIILKVFKEEFYEGCTIPISVMASDGNTQVEEIEILVNGESLGKKKSSPHISYWFTESYLPGDYIIHASFTSREGNLIEDEVEISILPISIECPDYLFDIDGNRYSVVRIGNQCWMGENLRTTRYANGDPLNNGNSPMGDSIISTFSRIPESLFGWYITYDGDPVNAERYGYLYPWPTVVNGIEALKDSTGVIQGIAPDGWHVPEVEEWRTLIDFLGGVEIAGNKLKDLESPLWSKKEQSTSMASEIKALPGGCSIHVSSYIEEGESSYFWTATPTIANHAYHILLSNYDSRANVLGHQDSHRFGYSVRCVMN